MMAPLLALRINRRAIAAVVLENESAIVADGRHLSSQTERAVQAAVRYISRLIQLTQPTALIVDAPTTQQANTTRHILDALEQLSADHHLPLTRVLTADILAAYGNPALETREEVREIVSGFWPQVDRVRGAIKPFVVDAAAAALFADCRLALEPAAS
jgi:hypothetical protein